MDEGEGLMAALGAPNISQEVGSMGQWGWDRGSARDPTLGSRHVTNRDFS